LKAELGMKTKKDEDEERRKVFFFQVPMDHEDKDSKTYLLKIKKYDTGTPEELLRCRMTLNEQMKNHGYSGNYEMFMNLAQAMLVGRGLKSFLSEQGAQESKNNTRKAKAKDQTEYTPYHMYDCTIFELIIRAFHIQNVLRDTFERQREYRRRDIFMGKLSPEKLSHTLQDMNKYLDCIPIGKSTGAEKTQKAYGKSLPDDDIGSIMGQAIPHEWTVNM
jgi:hypothetical protein